MESNIFTDNSVSPALYSQSQNIVAASNVQPAIVACFSNPKISSSAIVSSSADCVATPPSIGCTMTTVAPSSTCFSTSFSSSSGVVAQHDYYNSRLAANADTSHASNSTTYVFSSNARLLNSLEDFNNGGIALSMDSFTISKQSGTSVSQSSYGRTKRMDCNERNNNGNSATAWGGWLKTAGSFVTSKVTQLQQEIQPDLEEFVNNIRNDATNWVKSKSSKMISKSSSPAKKDDEILNKSKEMENSNNGGVKKVQSCVSHASYNSNAEQDMLSAKVEKTNTQPAFLLNASATLRSKYHQMRKSESTFTEEKWNLDAEKEKYLEFGYDNSDILEWFSDDVVMSMKTKLVPSVVSEEIFWKRFLYKLNLLKKEEENLSIVLRNVKNDEKKEADEEDIAWDDADESSQASSWENISNENFDYYASFGRSVSSSNRKLK